MMDGENNQNYAVFKDFDRVNDQSKEDFDEYVIVSLNGQDCLGFNQRELSDLTSSLDNGPVNEVRLYLNSGEIVERERPSKERCLENLRENYNGRITAKEISDEFGIKNAEEYIKNELGQGQVMGAQGSIVSQPPSSMLSVDLSNLSSSLSGVSMASNQDETLNSSFVEQLNRDTGNSQSSGWVLGGSGKN